MNIFCYSPSKMYFHLHHTDKLHLIYLPYEAAFKVNTQKNPEQNSVGHHKLKLFTLLQPYLKPVYLQTTTDPK